MSDVSDPSGEHPPRLQLDYDLKPTVRADTPGQLKALGHPVRNAILHLVLERAATTSELADAVGKSHGTVAHHLKVLEEAGLMRVVRTRQVRAVTESYWGRTGRTIFIEKPPGVDTDDSFLREAMTTFVHSEVGITTLRYARISAERAEEYVRRLDELALEFAQEERAGTTAYGLLLALQATDQPVLADRRDRDRESDDG